MDAKGLLSKLRERGTTYQSKGDVWDSVDAQARWPVLYQLLAVSLDGDVRRDPSKITVYVNQGEVYACVRCPSEGHNAHLRIDPGECLFDTLESFLAAGKADFRPYKQNGRR